MLLISYLVSDKPLLEHKTVLNVAFCWQISSLSKTCQLFKNKHQFVLMTTIYFTNFVRN